MLVFEELGVEKSRDASVFSVFTDFRSFLHGCS